MKTAAPSLFALLAVAVAFAGQPAQLAHADPLFPPDTAKCGVIDLNRVLRESVPANRIRDKLQREFEPADAKIIEQMDPYNSLQRKWLDARKAGDEALARQLRMELDEMGATIEKARRKFNSDLSNRQNQELGPLLKRVEAAYIALGEEDGFDMLYQTSEKSPVWLKPGLPRLECGSKTDLTTPLIRELDVASKDD